MEPQTETQLPLSKPKIRYNSWTYLYVGLPGSTTFSSRTCFCFSGLIPAGIGEQHRSSFMTDQPVGRLQKPCDQFLMEEKLFTQMYGS